MTGLYVASNTKALGSQIQLQRNVSSLSDVLTRLSTGLKINSGKDDPAGLIASELLKSDIVATKQAIQNTQRANSVLAVADSALGQVSSLLNDVRQLVNQSANEGVMTEDMIAANQLQVNASIDSIDRIAKTTNFQGKKILDGSMDFSTTGLANNKNLENVVVQSANLGENDSMEVKVKLLEASKKGTLIYNGTGVDEDVVVSIAGSQGSEIFKFGAGSTTADMAARINAVSASTGVQARVEGEAAKGIITLGSVGSNNDIVVSAKDKGFDAGNYTFRVVAGERDVATVVSEPEVGKAGVIEIQLQESYSAEFDNFGGLFDIRLSGIDADGKPDPTSTPLVSIHQGAATTAVYNKEAQDAKGVTSGTDTRKVVSVSSSCACGASNISELNGWTFQVTDDVQATTYNLATKTVYLNSCCANTEGIQAAVDHITGVQAGCGARVTISGAACSACPQLEIGDKFKLSSGSEAHELSITYKAGDTVNDVLNAIGKAAGVQASLAPGVDGTQSIASLLSGKTRVASDGTFKDPYTSSVTASDLMQILNRDLGDLFDFELATNNDGSGYVSYMDASATSGSVNLDNGLLFTGMDHGPVVRMVTTNPDGTPIGNQKLSLELINPTDADRAAGRDTKILQINLATDAAGNSITTAADIAKLFENSTALQTAGINATVLLPDGVDPNGRTWTLDDCDNMVETKDCNATYGLGIVQPTGTPGTCEIQQNDVVLLGANQKLTENGTAIARISGILGCCGAVAAVASNDAMCISTVNNTSALNGISFKFTTDAGKAGFDKSSGTLVTYLNPETTGCVSGDSGCLNTELTQAVNGAIMSNWQAIREYTKTTEGPEIAEVSVEATGDAAAVLNSTEELKFMTNVGSASCGAAGCSVGVGASDSVLNIEAKNKGTALTGTKILLEYKPLAASDACCPNPAQISVKYDEKNGTLTITSTEETVDAATLAAALKNNDTFDKYFKATAINQANIGEAAYGQVVFGSGVVPHAEMVGGYSIETEENTNNEQGVHTAISSGIAMRGNTDENQRLILEATESGSKNYVKVSVSQGSFRTFCPLGLEMEELAGTDARITVNGQKTDTNGDSFSASDTNLEVSGTVKGLAAGESTSFTITGGGALFQLGPDVVSTQQTRIGIQSVDSTTLGGASGKLYMLKAGEKASLSNDTKLADKIVQEAINSIAVMRGRIGAVQKSTLEPNQAVLEDTVEALSSAEALISNADFAEESSALTRAQILVQSGSQVLALANQFPQYAAQLVG